MHIETSLSNMVAIVTGGNQGIGRSIALALAGAGAKIALAARSTDKLDAVRNEIADMGVAAFSFPTDLAEENQIAGLMKDVIDHFGRLDILVNNAGTGFFGPLEESTTSQWDDIMTVNARGPYMLCREAIQHLRKQKLSFIVNIGSVVSVKGYPDQAAYSASKHALLGMSKSLAKEVHKDNIRVHAVCPGGVHTEFATNARPDLDTSVLIHPDDIADIVLFLVTRRGNSVIDEIYVRRSASTPWA